MNSKTMNFKDEYVNSMFRTHIVISDGEKTKEVEGISATDLARILELNEEQGMELYEQVEHEPDSVIDSYPVTPELKKFLKMIIKIKLFY